jgi:phosphate transport system substrate-binding protein
MKRRVFAGYTGVMVAGALGVPVAHAQQTVTIDGSSTVYPIAEAVAEEFKKAQRGAIRVTVGVSGTGGGFRRFCRGEIDIANASRPIRASEIEECRRNGVTFLEMPVGFDALTVVVNPRNTWLPHITVEELKRMWEPEAAGRIMRWNQVNPAWPDRPLRLFGPGTASGTFDYFTEAVVGRAKASRGDYTASEDDHVLVVGISRDENALGYFGYAYFHANRERLRALPISWRGGAPVMPSAETVINGTYQPLSRPLFIYVRSEAARRPEVRSFLEFLNRDQGRLTREVGFVELPAAVYAYNLETLARMRLGSKFGGETVVGIGMDRWMQMVAR